MNWEEVGAIGQVLGSIAVFITLVYLAIQNNHTKDELRRSTSQRRGEAARQLLINRANNERIDGLESKARAALGWTPAPDVSALMERAGLTLKEAHALSLAQYADWQYRTQTIPFAAELGLGERIQFDSVARFAYGRDPLGRLWYEAMKATLNPDAVRYVDDLLARPG